MYVGPQLRAWKTQVGDSTHRVGPPAYFSEKEFLDILKNYMLHLLQPVVERLLPDEIFLEKTPSHALFIPEIKQLLPESRIIHILRDPRDVVASLLAAGRTWGSNWAPKRANIAAHIWVDHVRAAREAAKSLSRNEFCEISYEDLSKSPEDSLKRLSRFLGLDWSQDAIENAVVANRPEAMQSGGTPIPVYGEVAKYAGSVAKLPQGFVRKARPNVWKTELSLPQKLWIWRVVGKTMQENGYPWLLRDWL
jgi:hypothetical protein